MKTKLRKRSAEITVETDEFVVLKGSPAAVRLHCPACRREVLMLSPEQAARIAGVSARTIYRWVEAGGVHFREANGNVGICLRSLCVRAKDVDGEVPAETRSSRRRKP